MLNFLSASYHVQTRTTDARTMDQTMEWTIDHGRPDAGRLDDETNDLYCSSVTLKLNKMAHHGNFVIASAGYHSSYGRNKIFLDFQTQLLTLFRCYNQRDSKVSDKNVISFNNTSRKNIIFEIKLSFLHKILFSRKKQVILEKKCNFRVKMVELWQKTVSRVKLLF